jgi:hypothetical protein
MAQRIFVPARVRVGFEALPADAYNALFTDPNKIDFKTQVRNEIWAEITEPFRNTWNSLSVSVTEPDQHLTEDEIHTWLDTNLLTLTGNPNITLDNNPETYLAAVEYLFWDKIRECEHKHLLLKNGAPWIVSFAAPNFQTQLFIQLAWDTPT